MYVGSLVVMAGVSDSGRRGRTTLRDTELVLMGWTVTPDEGTAGVAARDVANNISINEEIPYMLEFLFPLFFFLTLAGQIWIMMPLWKVRASVGEEN